MPSWIEHEWRSVDLSDSRWNDRFRVLLARLSDQPTPSIPAVCNGWAETQAADRFFDNDRRHLKPHFEATLERIRQQPVVLVAQDTTELAERAEMMAFLQESKADVDAGRTVPALKALE